MVGVCINSAAVNRRAVRERDRNFHAFNRSVGVWTEAAILDVVNALQVEVVGATPLDDLVVAIQEGAAVVLKAEGGRTLGERRAATEDEESDYHQAFQFQRIFLLEVFLHKL